METTPAVLRAEDTLFIVGVILLSGAVSGFVAQKLRVPDIVLFLLVGIVLGPAVTGIINVPATSALNEMILIFGASYILFDGGATLHLKVLREIWVTLVIIATIGVLITTFIMGFVSQWLLGLPFIAALLLGATIASTDPATLVPVFKQVRIKHRVSQLVMSESAFNDAMGAIITFTVLAIAVGKGSFSFGASLADLLLQAGIGIVAGAILGYASVFLIAHERFGFLREYLPIVTLLAVVGAYLSAVDLNASGFMAVFVAGIFIGNKETFGFAMEEGESEKMTDFIETTALIMRMFIFMLLGSQVDFHLLGQYFWAALAVVAIFMLIARPVTVFLCAGVDRRAKWTLKELLFISWVRETGVIPGALAGLLVGMKAPHADIIAAITFMAILLTIVIQATTTKWLAGKLDLLIE